jgi:hypothetical protein
MIVNGTQYVPKELFIIISHELPINYLLLVNKLLNSLYNDNWYKEYLENKYPTINLTVRTTYKDLCKKSLYEGRIYYSQQYNTFIGKKYLNITGIKALWLDRNHIILKFNGDLYRINNNSEQILIDNNVSNMSFIHYVKYNKLYKFKYIGSSIIGSLCYEFDENLNYMIEIILNSQTIICSDYKVYLFDDINKIVIDNREFNIKIIDGTYRKNLLILIFEDGSINRIKLNHLHNDNVMDYRIDKLYLYKDYSNLCNKWYYYHYCCEKIEKIPQNLEIINNIIIYGCYVTLIKYNNNKYLIINNERRYIKSSIINITGDSYGIYEIHK